MPEIAAIGGANSIMMFKAAGAATFEAQTGTEAQSAIRDVLENNFALVLISENLQPALQETLDDNPQLVYLYIPPIREANKAGTKFIEDTIQRAVGKPGH